MWSADPALAPWLNRPLCILHGQKFIFFCGKNASGKPATLNQCKTQEWLFKEGATPLFPSAWRLNLLLQSSWGQSKMHSDGKFTVYLILWHGSKSEREKKTESKLQDSRTLSHAHAGCAAKWRDRMDFQDISHQSVSVWTYQVSISQLKLPTTRLCQTLLGINGKQLFPQREKKSPWMLSHRGHVLHFW